MNRFFIKASADGANETEGVNALEIRFEYDKGGIDFRGRNKPRGYYVYLILCNLRNGFVSFSPNGKSGYFLLKEVKRASVKAEAEARRLAYEEIPILISRLGVNVQEDYGDKLKGVLV